MEVFMTILKVILLLSNLSEALHCGENALRVTKIIGGKNSKKHEFPWQASIRWRVGMTKGDHICGGSLIHVKYVLTAAHCFALGEDPEYYNVTLGGHNRDSPDNLQEDMEIKKITIHRNYGKPVKYNNDIALIELKRPARFNNGINTICLPTFLDFEKPNKMCMISGWGKTDEEIDELPKILQKAQVPIVRFSTCNSEQSYNGRLSLNMFCAGFRDGRIDSCVGDSGGPMQCKSNGYYTLQGVTSFGDGCGQANKYGVYTVVRHYLEWINIKTKGQVKIPRPRPLVPRPPVPTPPLPTTKKVHPMPPIPMTKKVHPRPPIPMTKKVHPRPPIPVTKKIPLVPPIPTENKVHPRPPIPMAKVNRRPPIPMAKVNRRPPIPIAKVNRRPPIPIAKVNRRPPIPTRNKTPAIPHKPMKKEIHTSSHKPTEKLPEISPTPSKSNVSEIAKSIHRFQKELDAHFLQLKKELGNEFRQILMKSGIQFVQFRRKLTNALYQYLSNRE